MVKETKDYMGDKHLTLANHWLRLTGTAESTRTGIPQSKTDYAGSSEEELQPAFERMHLQAVKAGAELTVIYN